MLSFLPVEEQFALIARGAAQIETVAELKQKLQNSFETGKPLRVKYGIDPTGFEVHLGHTVPLRKLRQFQELGHTAVLIIGTATAQVGDPSGRDDSRAGLSPEQIQTNAAGYLEQIAKVIDVSKAEVRPNADWFHAFDFAQMLRLLGSMTIQRMLERDDFDKRLKAGVPIYLHECLYPLMQGYDSLEIDADVELGGTEQLFNLMVGRNLQRAAGKEPQICLTSPILRGLDGVKKMGKSLGNFIGLAEAPKDMFGKTMRIADSMMREWFTLLTDFTEEKIEQLLSGKPNEAKKALAAEIVRGYHGEQAAEQVLADWRKQFEIGGDPDDIPEVLVSLADTVEGAMQGPKLLVAVGLAKSNSEARKKIEEGAFNFGPDRFKPVNWSMMIPVTDGLVLRLGRKIVRVRLG